MPNELELLAPAGSMDALKAALANGADAVYLGASAFGARASAGFDEGTLRDALSLCHLYRKKVYVTVNILVKERELPSVRNTLSLLSRLGADAVLLQDLGLMKICREDFPELTIHASTQMALHHASGAALLKKLGARRVVLARECDLSAIRRAAETGMEIEAFCHGALCVSCSGQCLLSSMIGGRSGNRGRCAQPCRLPYTYQGETAAFLSPRDLCARDALQEMAAAGVYSFKIEGRLKRPEYVAVVTRAYRRALDAVLENRFAPASQEEKEGLTQIFSRGGFTRGYIGAERDAAIIDPSRVTPAGLPLGRVERCYQRGGALLADVRLVRPLHQGDGLEIGGQTLRYSGPEAEKGEMAVLRLRDRVSIGASVRRTEDERQLAQARETYEGERLHQALSIPFDAHMTALPGVPLSLYVTDGESHVTAMGESCQAAERRALDPESARRALEKTGGTAFTLREFTLDTENAFVPAASLNALRREALEKLAQARTFAHPRAAQPARVFSAPGYVSAAPRLLARTGDFDEIPLLLAAGADEVLFAPRDYRKGALRPLLRCFPEKTRLVMPVQCREETWAKLLSLAREYGLSLCLSSPGQLQPGDFSVMAGEGIPVMNGETARMLAALGCRSVTLSRELSGQEICDLPRDVCEYILPVYGRARLMVLNHCPMRTHLQLRTGREACTLCAQGKGAAGTCLQDRMNARYPLFPLHLPEGCLVEMMADRPLQLSGLLGTLPPVSYLLQFTDEPSALRQQLLGHYRALLLGKTPAPLKLNGTPGRFQEGVL